jgi:hypothetical protein
MARKSLKKFSQLPCDSKHLKIPNKTKKKALQFPHLTPSISLKNQQKFQWKKSLRMANKRNWNEIKFVQVWLKIANNWTKKGQNERLKGTVQLEIDGWFSMWKINGKPKSKLTPNCLRQESNKNCNNFPISTTALDNSFQFGHFFVVENSFLCWLSSQKILGKSKSAFQLLIKKSKLLYGS